MANAGKIARRTLLIGSAAIVGGVAFGAYLVKKPHPNPLLDDLADGEASFNPWIKISKDAVTFITPHADIGQGVYSMQAALIAEELDIEFGQFEITPGEPAPAYYNTVFGSEGVPFMSTDQSFRAESMRTIMSAAVKMLGLQGTGGSSSVPDSFDKLRLAGAIARETLKKAASEETGIPVEQLKTGDGAVTLPDGQTIPYTALAATAAKIHPEKNVTLRKPNEWRFIGKPMQRLDVLAKSTGAPIYGIDLEMDGMVYAALRTNPRQGGILKGYDASAAKSMRGVKKVLDVKNGVAVIADNTWRAMKAVNEINCDFGPAPYPAEMPAHWQTLSDSFTEERIDKVWLDNGDVDGAFAGNDIFEVEYRAPYVAHAPLEPLNALILVTDERVDIWAGHQIPLMLEQRVAAITGIDAENVHFHNQYSGGSFGHRLEFDNIDYAAEIGMQMKGVPVKLTYTREEDFLHDYRRQIAMARPRGVVKDGKIDAIDLSVSAVSTVASQMGRAGIERPGPDTQIPAGAWNMPYAIPNFRMTAYKAPPLAPVSSWRSVGASTSGFFADCIIDELCHEAGADPLEERIRLANNESARKVLEKVGDLSGWGGPLAPNRGRGVALVTSFGVPVAEVVEITNTDLGIKIDKVFVVADVGRVVDPINFENHVQGAVVWALGHAINCEITYTDGIVDQTNYHTHAGMRLYQCPEIIVHGLEFAEKIRGIGEPPVPPAAPALANAIFATTGKRIREMPFNKHIDFV